MSQSRARPPIVEMLIGTPTRPDPMAWPPPVWVSVECAALGMVQVTHRSGVQIVKLADGTVIVRRSEGPEARWISNIIEDHPWGSGYKLTYGGGPNDMLVAYVRPDFGAKDGKEGE